MTTNNRSVDAFRQRLQQLILDRHEGRYSRPARRARMPLTSLQHILHRAKRFPGGAQLLRLATALEVSVDFLLTGHE